MDLEKGNVRLYPNKDNLGFYNLLDKKKQFFHMKKLLLINLLKE